MTSLPRIIVITGTDTEVGKTVATAAIAAALTTMGLSSAAYKPTQTGVAPGEPGDMTVVERLARIPTVEGCRLTEPMAPRPAAAIDGATLPTLADHISAIDRLATTHDHVLVEGAGGLLVELTDAGETLADVAMAFTDVGVIVVARSALGTLNHTMLTREALSYRAIRNLGTIIGAWPDRPSAIESTNRSYIAALPEGLLGTIPLGSPTLEPRDFARQAETWLPGLVQRRGIP